MKKKEIFEFAKKLALEYRSNPKKLAKELEIVVKYRSFNQHSGSCIRMNDKQLIVINNKMSELKQLFVLAHEIAHLLLHPYEATMIRYFSFSESKIEFEANFFAVVFFIESEMEFEEDEEIGQLINNMKIYNT